MHKQAVPLALPLFRGDLLQRFERARLMATA